MIKKILLLFGYVLISVLGYTQETTPTEETTPAVNDEDKKPVRDPWACNMIIDNQTTLTPSKGSMEFIIHHRFTGFGNGIDDLFGLYGASNIRLGINYAISDKIMIGFGSEKDRKYQEFLAKVKLLEQNRGGSIPISLVLFGNTCINGREKEFWGNNYKYTDRLSYFGQLIISRKFTDAFSFQVAASYSHFNKVESTTVTVEDSSTITTMSKSLYQNDVLGISAGGRLKVYNEISLLAEYDQGFYLTTAEAQQLVPKPNLALGFEIGTSTHAFQLFASTYRGITPQQNIAMNQADFHYISEVMLGFNVTVRF